MMANQAAAKSERTLASDFVATISRPAVCRVFDIAGQRLAGFGVSRPQNI
jgi:hypothetical protein